MERVLTLTALLQCPGISRISSVVENALEDALLSVFRYEEVIEEGLYLGVYTRNLEDQFYAEDGESWVCFEGSPQEVWNFNLDPRSGFQNYAEELRTTLEQISDRNKTLIADIQRIHHNGQFVVLKRLPNHWLIGVKE